MQDCPPQWMVEGWTKVSEHCEHCEHWTRVSCDFIGLYAHPLQPQDFPQPWPKDVSRASGNL